MARRVQFGTTWWGKQWIDALTHLDYENRLPRGRTYYNTGRIDDMQFNPAKLRVEAIAHGSAYSPYEVAIDLKPLPSEDVTRLVDAVAERPALLAKLLEGAIAVAILTSPSRCSSRILLSGLRSPIPRGRQKRGTAKRSLCSRKLRADISSASRRFCPHRSRAGRRFHATAMKSSSPP